MLLCYFCLICVNFASSQIYMDNLANETFQDGSLTHPFTSLEKVLKYPENQIKLENPINIILLSNKQNYSIHSTISINFSLNISFSNNNFQKAGIIFHFGQFEIDYNGKVIKKFLIF